MRKIILYTLFLLSLFSVLSFSEISAYISKKRPLITCQQWGFHKQQEAKSYTHPDKLVVRPWRGPHNVYALFLIPSEYRSEGLFTVTIPGDRTYCGRFQDIGKVSSGVDEEKNYTIIRGFLNTRIALKLIAEGQLDQLRKPDNWRLGYFKR
ncbi:hypothetical protein [Anabaena sp. CCY 0017]|uniref:hypothetical protein n=1 Tax=Anabaena sp. CCY 0017 TaxID=3103866 RepID=UPI0039C73AC7